jgi:hypothetical protein
MLQLPKTTARAAPLLTGDRKRRAPSRIETTCALLETATADFMLEHKRFADAEGAVYKAMPRAHKSLRATKANRADVPSLVRGYTPAIPSGVIRAELQVLRSNRIKSETVDGVPQTIISDVSFPLSAKQQRRIERLEARLTLAEAHEAKCNAIKRDFKLRELERAASVADGRQSILVTRLARLCARTRDDLLAKVEAYRAEQKFLRGSEGEVELAHSIVRDVERLAAASTI